MTTSNCRKCLSAQLDPSNYTNEQVVSSSAMTLAQHTINSSSSSLRMQEDRENNLDPTSNFTATCCYNSFKLNPPFDSAMALTVLVLLTALFFMGFFSIYIRRFTDDSSVDPTRRRRRGSTTATVAGTAAYGVRSKKGLDPTVVSSLPVYMFNGGDVEKGVKNSKNDSADVAVMDDELECAICLSEFEQGDWVKGIPYCGHVFHVKCIDTWLSSHVTCPLCRTAEFFPPIKKVEAEDVANVEDAKSCRGEVSGHVESHGEGEVGEERETWQEVEREVGPTGVMGTSSCTWFGERVTLHRSLSL